MKTNFKTNENRIQETILKSFIALAIIILSVSVSAQNFWASREGNYYELMQLVTSSETAKAKTLVTVDFAALAEQEEEESLEVEDWMTNKNNFGMFIDIENAFDNPLELEEWMTNDANFEASETDAALQLESWMINEGHFTGKYQSAVLEEKPLQLEEWMIDDNTFKF